MIESLVVNSLLNFSLSILNCLNYVWEMPSGGYSLFKSTYMYNFT